MATCGQRLQYGAGQSSPVCACRRCSHIRDPGSVFGASVQRHVIHLFGWLADLRHSVNLSCSALPLPGPAAFPSLCTSSARNMAVSHLLALLVKSCVFPAKYLAKPIYTRAHMHVRIRTCMQIHVGEHTHTHTHFYAFAAILLVQTGGLMEYSSRLSSPPPPASDSIVHIL